MERIKWKLGEEGNKLMGMYCCCDWKMTPSYLIDMVNKTHTTFEVDPDGCKCDWNGWTSIYDWPDERKNKEKPFCNPTKNGKYLVRIQNQCGDRCETESKYCSIPRKIPCNYTGKILEVYWSGEGDEQPYAWKEIN